MALANRKQKKQWVVAKLGKYATAGGGLGARPKVYDTAAAAKYDIDTNPKLRGGIVQPYTAEAQAGFEAAAGKANRAAAHGPGEIQGVTPSFATTTKAKAAQGKGKAKAGPKRAAAGK
jgi:hypothetical protein